MCFSVTIYLLIHRIQAHNVVQESKDVQLKSDETKFETGNAYVHQENPPAEVDYEAVVVPTGVSYTKPKPLPKP